MHIGAVRDVLAEIGADHVPELVCFNKIDLLPAAEVTRLVDRHPGSVAASASTGEGVEGLLTTVADRLRSLTEVVELLVPWDRGDVLAEVHREGEVLSEAATDEGMRIRARLDEAGAGRLGPFLVDGRTPTGH
jgi:GTP-binding protein HflX